MPEQPDQDYLKLEQYKDANHLKARIQLHRRYSTNPYGWFRWVFDQIDLAPQVRLLEIGCGSGTLWCENIDRIPPGWHLYLSDFSQGMIKEATNNLGVSLTNLDYVICDGIVIPFQNNSFDAVIANHMLYHINDRQKALEEVNRVLKPGGTFFASTIGESHLKELSQIMVDSSVTYRNYYSPALNPSGFTLENGIQQLAPWFETIDIRLYPDALIVTDAEPLMGYILSMLSESEIIDNRDELVILTKQISQMIKEQGSIHIHKSSGMFIGRKKGTAHV